MKKISADISRSSKIKFILNQPRNPKNIGAAARGMANFGFRKLIVANPYFKAWREVRSAVHAADVVKKAKKVADLKEALKSTHLIIGTSAGSRRAIKGRWLDLPDLLPLLQRNIQDQKSIAIVFGSEKSGLSNADLDFCHYVVKIPTDADCPSMNLAQAVAVVAYAIRKSILIADASPNVNSREKAKPLSADAIERLIGQGLSAFNAAGLLKGWTLERSEGRLRRSLHRWGLNEVDVAMLHSLFRWVIKKGNQS